MITVSGFLGACIVALLMERAFYRRELLAVTHQLRTMREINLKLLDTNTNLLHDQANEQHPADQIDTATL